MSDESPNRDHELASQYVDGQVSAPERARVEATPALLELARRFESQREALAAVPAASAAARETAVAAALAASTTVAPPPNVVSLDRRRWAKGWLTAAAAVAVLGLGAVGVAAMFAGSGSDDASSSAVEPLAGDSQKGDVATVADGSLGATDTREGGIDTTAGGGTGAGTTDTTNAAGAGVTTPESIDQIVGPSSAVPEVHTTADLRSLPEPPAAVSPSFEFDCPLTADQSIIAEITWKGTPAVVVRDTVTGVITALDSQCTVLATVEP